MTTALLIIDIQHALCQGDEAAFDIDRVIDRINSVSAKARAAGLPVVLVQHEENEGPLQFDSEGWQLAGGLVTQAADLRVRKTATDAFHRTELHALLQQRGVDHLIVCGVQSEFCVDSSVRGALALGYAVSLVADAHSTIDNSVLSAAQISAHHTATLANVSSYAQRVTPVLAAELVVGN